MLDLVIANARIVRCDRDVLDRVEHGEVGVRDGRVVEIGDLSDRKAREVIDAAGQLLLPGLVDPHTHLVFAGSRVAELERKLAGESYGDIAAGGGGIASTVGATRAASDDTLFALAKSRALALRALGVTTIEVKSGYGLTLADELRILRVARQLEADGIVRVCTTLLAAHAVPPERADDRDGWIREITEVVIPQVVRERLADACDVYCDEGAFTVAEARTVLTAARAAGMKVKAHAGQFADLGACELVAELGGLSCDHVEHASDAALAAMARASVTAVLLPGAWRTLRQTPPDAARLRRAGVRVAVGTDLNPGTSALADLGTAAALAARDAGLTLSEAVLGITAHAARALGRDDVGRIAVGAHADLALFPADDPRVLAYALSGVRPSLVVLGGRVVERGSSAALW